MNNFKVLKYLLFISVLSCSVYAEGEAFEATDQNKLESFYAKPERSVTVNIHSKEKLHTVSDAFLGINMSYFNTTDDIWQKYSLREKLKSSGVGALRYPGGEETSFFHWEHAGVNGYEDVWDPKEKHGTAPGRGKFQTTWVSPDKWDTNENFMNFDEFMENCIDIGAEPIVGVNLSSGKKLNRRADGIQEALRWMRYCKKKGYRVRYWFFDNEPWHFEGAYTFKGQEYADEVIAYGTVIKKEFPDAKLIVNPTSSGSYNWWEGLEQFVRKTGDVIDYIDVHWYWAWGQGTFERWVEQKPLQTGDKWKKKEWDRPYADDIRMIKETIKKAGHDDIGFVVLEWNVAPSDHSQTFNQSLLAVIQAELLMEYLKADVRMTCMWPLLWRTSRDVWSEQDFFPSIITQDPPFEPTLSHKMFRMISDVQGKTLLRVESSNKDCNVVAAEDSQGKMLLLFVNKNALRRKITIGFDEKISGKATAEMIGLKHQVSNRLSVIKNNERQISFYAEPYSFSTIRISQ